MPELQVDTAQGMSQGATQANDRRCPDGSAPPCKPTTGATTDAGNAQAGGNMASETAVPPMRQFPAGATTGGNMAGQIPAQTPLRPFFAPPPQAAAGAGGPEMFRGRAGAAGFPGAANYPRTVEQGGEVPAGVPEGRGKIQFPGSRQFPGRRPDFRSGGNMYAQVQPAPAFRALMGRRY